MPPQVTLGQLFILLFSLTLHIQFFFSHFAFLQLSNASMLALSYYRMFCNAADIVRELFHMPTIYRISHAAGAFSAFSEVKGIHLHL